MKKFAIALVAAGIGLIALAPAASATKPDEDGKHKVTICHNVGHNGHAISIDVAAVGITDLKGGHGVLTLDENWGFVSFVPHETEGHYLDFFLHIGAENKPEDDARCQPEEPTTTTTQPPTTTTTEPTVVTTTTQPPVVTTTTQPGIVTTTTQAPPVTVTTTPPATDTPAPAVVTPAPVVNPVPATELPHTGSSWTLMLALVGAGLGLVGIGFRLLGRSSATA